MNRRLRTSAALRRRARAVVTNEWRMVKLAALTFVCAAPLSLLAGTGIVKVLGAAYLGVYLVWMAVPTAVNVLAGYDAVRILFRKEAIVLPSMVRLVATNRAPTRTRLVEIAIQANPALWLATLLWMMAAEYNRKGYIRFGQQMDELISRCGDRKPNDDHPVLATPSAAAIESYEWQQDVVESMGLATV